MRWPVLLLLLATLPSLGGCISGPPRAAPSAECEIYLAVLGTLYPAPDRPIRLSAIAIAGGRLEPDSGTRAWLGYTVRWPIGRSDMTACPGFTERARTRGITLVTPSYNDLANPDAAGDASRPGSIRWLSRPAFGRDGLLVWIIYGSGHGAGAILKGHREAGGWVFEHTDGDWVVTS